MFRGEFDTEGDTINGEWADVPAEVTTKRSMNHDYLTLKVIKSDSKITHLKFGTPKRELTKLGTVTNWPKQD